MDHFDYPLRPYDTRDQYYPGYDGPYASPVSYQNSYTPAGPQQSQNGPILPELIDDVDAEYLNQVDKCTDQNSDSEAYVARKYLPQVSSPGSGTAEDFISSRTDPKTDNKTNIKVQESKPYSTNPDKDYIQNCQEINKYSDLIKFPEMTSVASPTTSSASFQSSYQQRTLMAQSQDSYDEDSAGK